MSLMELLLALAIVSMVAVASYTVLAGALNTERYMETSTNTTTAMELLARRIMHNVRTASALTTPANATPTSTLTLVTQPDPANGNAKYTVTYSLAGGQLTETDTRYGSNVLLKNVTAFTVTLVNAATPEMVRVAITATVIDATVKNAQAAPVTRQFDVTFRNL